MLISLGFDLPMFVWINIIPITYYNTHIYRLTENYQVINYGLGGYITDHTDDAILPSRVAFEIGGGRIFTALLYLSDDVIGGKTIFPMVDVGIAPEAGAIALFLIKECNVKTL